MGVSARLPGTELAFLSRLSATSGAPHRQCLFLGDFHGYIMRVYSAARWSILTSTLQNENPSLRALRKTEYEYRSCCVE